MRFWFNTKKKKKEYTISRNEKKVKPIWIGYIILDEPGYSPKLDICYSLESA